MRPLGLAAPLLLLLALLLAQPAQARASHGHGQPAAEPSAAAYPDYDASDALRERNLTLARGAAGAGAERNDTVAWLRGLYEPAAWPADALAATPAPCRAHLLHLQRAIVGGAGWAARVLDASGRYSSQFFFGNDFWLGSLTLCSELQREAAAPFGLAFSVVRLRLGAPAGTPLPPQGQQGRELALGVCLPAACGPDAVRALLQAGRPAQGPRALLALAARRVPGPYRLAADPKFHVIGAVTVVLLLLTVTGSAFDLLRRRRRARPAPAPAPAPASGPQPPPPPPPQPDAEAQQTTKGPGKPSGPRPGPALAPGLAARLLLSFSALSNGPKLLQASSEDGLSAVHGLRFLSLAWVILVHTYLNVFAIAENKTLRTVTERNTLFQTVSNATYSVDTFFFISGLLMAFLFFRHAGPSPVHASSSASAAAALGSGARRFLALLLYRFARLTPAYLYVLGLVELSMRWIASVSVFSPKLADHVTCERFWWRNALYINSLYPRSEMCMLWSWYMANDTQFYVLGLLLLFFAARYFWFVVASWSVFLVSSWCTTAFISAHYQYIARVEEPFALFDELYDKPWTRIGPYLVGMATGWLLQKKKCKINLSPIAVLLGWATSILCFIFLVYSVLHLKMNVLGSAVYVSLGHSAWGLALSWVVLACSCGYGGFVSDMLSFKAMIPLSRLTYCAYLTHPMIMIVTSFQMDGPLHLHNSIVLILFLGNLVASYILSFVISLLLESPLVRILKIVMGNEKKD